MTALLASFFTLCALQTLIGLAWDALLGDPPRRPHPARWTGRLIVRLEAAWHRPGRNLRLAGVALGLTVPATVAVVTLALMAGCALADTWLLRVTTPWFAHGARSVPWVSLLGGGAICGIWFAWRALADEAQTIHRLLATERLDEARRALAMIVGRDTAHLDEREIVRAVVETVAENSVDGGIAPVCFSLLGGPVLVGAFKAASTLDSMVGYKNERYRDFGMYSARQDDVLNYIPARLALVLVPLGAALCGLHPWRSFRIGRRDHARHPSPNSAWGESLFAGALGVQLGGRSTYAGVPSEKPLLGDAHRPLESRDIRRALRLLVATEIVIATLVAAGLLLTACQLFE